jgi:hypothetical protein
MGLLIFDLDGTLTHQRRSITATFEGQQFRGIPDGLREPGDQGGGTTW